MIDLIISLTILSCFMSFFSLANVELLGTKETLVSTLVLKEKINAIHYQVPSHIIIKNFQFNRYKNLPFNDCHLSFTKKGSASMAGTCIGKTFNLTLRPGEGGIGYPWR